MTHDDIEGTRPLIKKEYEERDPLKVSDIYGAQKKGIKPQRANYSNLNYFDVTGPRWRTKRNTNPLMPSYTVADTTDL